MKRCWLIVVALSLFMTACNKIEFDQEAPEKYFAHFIHKKLPKILPDGWYFEEDSEGKVNGGRAASVSFHFIDEQGNDLIDLNDNSTWPVPCYKSEYKSNPLSYYTTVDGKVWADLHLVLNKKIGYVGFNMLAPVNGKHIITFPLLFRGRNYEMKITYLYDANVRLQASADGTRAGKVMYARIHRWDLEGNYVYSDFERPEKELIYITLDKNGDIVAVQRKEYPGNKWE